MVIEYQNQNYIVQLNIYTPTEKIRSEEIEAQHAYLNIFMKTLIDVWVMAHILLSASGPLHFTNHQVKTAYHSLLHPFLCLSTNQHPDLFLSHSI